MKQWFSTSELSGTKGLPKTERGIVTAAKREAWKSRKKSIGKGKEYHIDSLPEKARIALIISEQRKNNATTTQGKRIATPAASPAQTESLWVVYDKAPQQLKDQANERLQSVLLFESLTDAGLSKGDAISYIMEETGKSRRSIYDYLTAIKPYAKSDWLAALLPRYAAKKKRRATCTDKAWEFFKADYLRPEKPDLRACYERLKRASKEHQWDIPTEKTLSNWIKKRVPAELVILKREGEHALMRRYPSQDRTVETLHALEWINGDGYQHNVFVIWPDGSIKRPKTWFWQDIYSRKILSYRVDLTENTDQIRLSFGDLVEQYGIPTDVTIDNTRAAANKWMTGGVPNRYRFKVKEDDPLGLFPSLGIKVHWTSVIAGKGHGQAKPIERAFGVGGLGEYVDKHPAFAGAYTGANPMAKPDNYADKAVTLDVFLTTLNQEIVEWNAREGRNTEMAGGVQSYDQVFNSSYKNAPIRKASIEQRRLWLLSAESINIKMDGSFTLDAGKKTGIGRNRYFSHDLISYAEAKKKIVIRFDPYSLHETVYCYTLDGRFICDADILDKVGFGDTHIARAFHRNRTQFVKAQKEAAKAEFQMDVLEVAEKLPAPTLPDPAANKVSRITPSINNIEMPPEKIINKPTEHELLAQEDVRKEIDNIISLPTTKEENDEDRYRKWHTLDERVKDGEELQGQESVFYRTLPETAEFKTFQDLTEMGMFELHG